MSDRAETPTSPVTLHRDMTYGDKASPMSMDVHEPSHRGPFPTMVLVHAISGEKEDLTQLAFALASQGILVLNINWRAERCGGGYPHGYRDVAAAVSTARATAGDFAGIPERVTLVTWADAALAGVVATLDPNLHCSNAAEVVVGLGGYYGWYEHHVPPEVVNSRTINFFGGTPAENPQVWRAGNPYQWLDRPSETEFLLLAGEADPLRADAERFAGALAATGHRVAIEVLPACAHTALVMPRHVSGRHVIESLRTASAYHGARDGDRWSEQTAEAAGMPSARGPGVLASLGLRQRRRRRR